MSAHSHSSSPHPTAVSAAGQLALWTAANLAGMVTSLLLAREPFFRRVANRIGGKRRRRVLRVKRPTPEQSLPRLAEAVLGSSRDMILAVLGPPRCAVFENELSEMNAISIERAGTWYYPLPRHGLAVMALQFQDDYAARVEFFDAPRPPAAA